MLHLSEVSGRLLGPHFPASRMQVELSNLIVKDMTRNGDAKDDQLVRVFASNNSMLPMVPF